MRPRRPSSSARGQVSPRELVDAAIARIERDNPELGAVIIPLFERGARDRRAAPHGPFRGVPILIKDIVATVGGRAAHRWACSRCAQRRLPRAGRQLPRRRAARAPASSSSARRTRASSASCRPRSRPRGRRRAIRTTARARPAARAAARRRRSPPAWSRSRTRTTAAARSASRRACCGLFGLKPSRGRVSLAPYYGDDQRRPRPRARGRALGARLRGRARLLAGMQPGDPYTAPPQLAPVSPTRSAHRRASSRIALRDAPRTRRPRASSSSRIPTASPRSRTRRSCSSRSATTSSPPRSPTLARSRSGSALPHDLGRSASPRDLDERRRAARPPDPEARGRAADLGARRARPADQRARVRRRVALAARGARAGSRRSSSTYDLWLTPTVTEPPVAARHVQVAARRSARRHLPRRPTSRRSPRLFNATGQPACSLPLYRNAAGLPIGVQLAAAYGREDLLFRVASQLEAAQPFDHAATRR